MTARKLILRNWQSPGDILMLTAAVRDLHLTYPGLFATDVRTSCAALWENNPYITPLREDDPDVTAIDCEYPLIHRSNQEPYHFIHGFIDFLNDSLRVAIRPTAFKGDIHLSDPEKSWWSQVQEITGDDTPFWIIVAGGKRDFTIKWWDTARYQAVVDRFRGRLQFVQVGEAHHHHPPLDGVIDLRGRTDLRQLVRLMYHARGVVSPVSFAMHLAAAVETRHGMPTRPCVVVAGGRESPHWEAYPHHQFLHTVGALACCAEGGCWKSRTLPLHDGDDKDRTDQLCVDVVDRLPRCMHMITADHVVDRIQVYVGSNGHHPPAVRSIPRPPMDLRDAPALTAATAGPAANLFLESIPPCPGGLHGRGIVICGGGREYFTNAWVCIRMLRHLGCGLPVQLWHLGRKELDDRMRALVAPFDVECVDACAMRERAPARILNGWELKPYAILHAPFKEVMLIDADNVPIVNPEFLFETTQFHETGALFWPDLGRLEPSRSIWDICGVGYCDEPEFESGQIVVDKERCWKALSLAMWYNEFSDFFYDHVHGDKETFHMAFRKCETRYAMPATDVALVGGIMCQHDFDGRRIFQHRQKWSLDGHNHLVDDLAHQERCETYLGELRHAWDGTIDAIQRFEASRKTPLERAAADALTATELEYHRVGYDRRRMRFSRDGTIRTGSAAREIFWDVSDEEGRLVLQIFSGAGDLTCRLTDAGNGGWSGRWIDFERMPVTLTPVPGRDGGAPEPATTLPFEEFCRQVIADTQPMSQNTGRGNLGFGWMYYGLIRNLRPDFVVAIGSARGFMPACAARAVQDNAAGQVIFIDPSYIGNGYPGWGGLGFWRDADEVRRWFAGFGLGDRIVHLEMTSREAFPRVEQITRGGTVGLVVIDGDHSSEGSLEDFELYSSLVTDGVVVFHDATSRDCGVACTIESLRARGFPVVTLHRDAGLSMVEISRPSVAQRWPYLNQASSRSRHLLACAQRLVRTADRVFDLYCGCSPLADLLDDVEFFGCDRDAAVIAQLRARLPRHRWEVIDEGHVPFAALPSEVDVLFGLGLSLGHAAWDPQFAVDNVRYLLGRYVPRAAMFETAADYYAADVLPPLRGALEKLRYRCWEETFDTDLVSFSRRRVLGATLESARSGTGRTPRVFVPSWRPRSYCVEVAADTTLPFGFNPARPEGRPSVNQNVPSLSRSSFGVCAPRSGNG